MRQLEGGATAGAARQRQHCGIGSLAVAWCWGQRGGGNSAAEAAWRRRGGGFRGRKHGFGMNKGDGGHEGCNYLAHRIGLDFISLPGQQRPSKTITVQGSRQAWLIKF